MKPWRKLRPPTGPISPAQNAPATRDRAEQLARRAPASWSGTPKRCRPRPLQVNSERGRGPRRRRAARAGPRRRRRRRAPGTARSGRRSTWSPTDERARLLVGAEHVAHEEVAAAELGLVLVDDEADVQAAPEQLALVVGRRSRRAPCSRVERGLPAELLDDVPLGARDDERARRPAGSPARRPCATVDAGEEHADRAVVEDRVVEHEPVAARVAPAADASPPITWSPGRSSLSRRRKPSTGNVNGSASSSRVDGPSGGSGSVGPADDRRCRRACRSTCERDGRQASRRAATPRTATARASPRSPARRR